MSATNGTNGTNGTAHTSTGSVTEERDLAAQRLAANAFVNQFSIERDRQFGAASSRFFSGSRDIYAVAGYPTTLSIEAYLGRYQRDPLAYRIVVAAPDDTWRQPFLLVDGNTLEDGVSDSEFVNAWNDFVQFDSLQGDLLDDSRRSLWHYFYDVDRQCGIGQYAVMILGFDDGLPLDQPLKMGQGKRLLYITVMNEYNAKVYPSSLITDVNNSRFGLPAYYDINYGDAIGVKQVHYSRIIHVAEGGVMFGKPRLEAVYNRLIDIEKLLSASGEAGWRAITRKIIISSKDGYTMGEGTVTVDKISDMIHGLRDVVELQGADVNVVSGDAIDPSGALESHLNMLCAGTGIPKRKLIGAEAGKLASGQEEKNWFDTISARRTHFVEPVIVRQFIKRMIYAGLLPMPSSNNYCLDWPSLFEADDVTQATTFLSYAQGLSYLNTPGVERIVKQRELVQYFVRGLPANAVPDDTELAALDAEAAQKQADALALAQAQKPADGAGQVKQAEPKGLLPVANSYTPTEQVAIFEAAARIVAEG